MLESNHITSALSFNATTTAIRGTNAAGPKPEACAQTKKDARDHQGVVGGGSDPMLGS